MSKTMSQIFMESNCEELSFTTIYSCRHKITVNPLEDYFEPCDGDLEEYLDDFYFDGRLAEEFSYCTFGNWMLVDLYTTDRCNECDKGKVYCKDMPETTGFETITKLHGVLAYGRVIDGNFEEVANGVLSHVNKILTNSNYETCCSTEALGKIGLVLDGKVITASRTDLNTHVDSKGRFFYMENVEEDMIVYDAKDLIPDEFGMNDEMVTINNTLKAVWIKVDADNNIRALAKTIAEKYNVEIIEVELTEADLEELDILAMYNSRNM